MPKFLSPKNKFRKTDGKIGADLNEPNFEESSTGISDKIDVEEYHAFRDSRERNFFLFQQPFL